MKLRANQVEQLTVRIICALALLVVGFAHQVPAFAWHSLSPAKLAQYALPDGTLPTLCTTVVDDTGKHRGKVGDDYSCDVCRSATALLPHPADAGGVWTRFADAAEMPRRVEGYYRQLYPPNNGPRAPPLYPILS